MSSKFVKLAAAGVLSLCTAASALAGSVTQPGETVGLASGAPLPQGLYFVNTGDWGRRSDPADTSVGVDIPVIAWSTPWTILGGRVQFLIAGPVVEIGVHNTNYLRGVYNPLVSGQLAWDLGNNWGFSYLLGAYINLNSEVAWSDTSLNQRFALSYRQSVEPDRECHLGHSLRSRYRTSAAVALPNAPRIERLQSGLPKCRSDRHQEVW